MWTLCTGTFWTHQLCGKLLFGHKLMGGSFDDYGIFDNNGCSCTGRVWEQYIGLSISGGNSGHDTGIERRHSITCGDGGSQEICGKMSV